VSRRIDGLHAGERITNLKGDPPPRQRRGLRASRGWPDRHAAPSSARATLWRLG
jgi:hypothetical protein